MKKIRAISGAFKELVFILALSAFLFRALVPVGFMADAHAASGDFITICSGYNESTIAVDANGNPLKPDQSHSQQPCSFSINAGGVSPALSLAILPIYYFATSYTHGKTAAVYTSHAAQPNPSRAPPSA